MIERIVFVRHGETVDNARGIAQGWSDSALSETGQVQVGKLARRLRSFEPTDLFCSTLPRAIATARAISDVLHLPIQQVDDLREMNCGDWEGISFADVREREPDVFRNWVEDPAMKCPGGESFEDLAARMGRALEHIQTVCNGRPRCVVIVSHGTAIRVVATSLLGLELSAAKRFAQDNAAINVFEWRASKYILRTWNDTTHCPS